MTSSHTAAIDRLWSSAATQFRRKEYLVIEFRRDVKLRRFTMRAGERWVATVWEPDRPRAIGNSYLNAAASGCDRFGFDGSDCLLSDVILILRTNDCHAAQTASEQSSEFTSEKLLRK